MNFTLSPLPRSFYESNTITVAKNLLGKYLVHKVEGETRIGKIIEVEAYLGEHDLACHSSKGRTKRTQVMFGPAGFAYIYLIYGMYYCFNVVTEKEEIGSAVLIRALEPIQSITLKTTGPGLLCRAMGIDKALNGHDLLSDDFFIAESNEVSDFQVKSSPRIGVHYAKEWAEAPLRFFIQSR